MTSDLTPERHRRTWMFVAMSHPFVFVPAIVLQRFSSHAASADELLRPLVVGWLIAGALMVMIGTAVRSREWAPMITSIGILLFFGEFEPGGFVLVLAIWWLLIAGWRRAHGRAPTLISQPRVPNQASFLCATVLLVSALWANLAAPSFPGTVPPLPAPTDQGGPDIFFILLDGYPRSDSLREDFGIDNRDFESRLEAAGFTVSPQARANYNKTWLTVPSILSGSYVHEHLDLSGPIGTLGQQARRLHELINSSPVLDYLRARGYEVVSIPSPVPTSDITANVTTLTSGWLSSFESAFVIRSMPGRIAPNLTNGVLADELRERLTTQFDTLAGLARATDSRPRFVFFHALSPHPPFILGQDADYLEDCFPICSLWSTTVEETGLTDGQYGARLGAQIRVLNELVIDAIGTIERSNPNAVILVLADHGARHSLGDLDEHFDVFFAARTVNEPEVFGADASLVNVFRRLLATYFGEALPDLDYAAWVSDWLNPLDLERYR